MESDSPRQNPPAPELDPAASPPYSSGRFLVLDNLELHKAATRVTCIARLRRRDQLFRGEAAEIDSPAGRARAAARATLSAAAHAIDGLQFGLEGVALADFFGRKYCVVSVEAAHQRRFIILSGIVALEASRSPEEAAALAALRAIDRWIAA